MDVLGFNFDGRPVNLCPVFAVEVEFVDGHRLPVRNFNSRAEAEAYRQKVIERHLHGYSTHHGWVDSHLILCRVTQRMIPSILRSK